MTNIAISDAPRQDNIGWFDLVFLILNVAAFNVVFWS